MNRLAGRFHQRDTIKQKSGFRNREAIEFPKSQIFGHAHAWHGRVLQGLFGEREQAVLMNGLARWVKIAAPDKNVTALDGALSADRLHQLLLPVP